MSGRIRASGRTKSAAELMAELKRDPAFVDRQKRMEEERRRSIQEYEIAANGILAELAINGYPVEKVGDLRKLGQLYREAVPILIRWLPEIAHSALKEELVRTLSVPWASDAAGPLIVEFQNANNLSDQSLRWTIGNALEVLANDELTEKMILLATDVRYGKAREMIVQGLGKLSSPRIFEVLLKLLDDEEVAGHAIIALGTLGASAARSHVEPFLTHPKAWIRKEAKKAIASIDKATSKRPK